MQKIKAVIFDLDGTIANTLPLCIQAFRMSVEPLMNRSLSDEDIIATFGPSEEGSIMALTPEHYEQGIKDYLRLYEQLHYICPEPFSGIRELLAHLKKKNVPVAMVTGKGKYSTAISLKQFNLAQYFETVETGSPKGARKEEGIKAVLQKWNHINKDEIIYVGDASSDITASRNAGIAVVAAAWAKTANAENLKALHPDEIFYSIDDFAKSLYDKI